MNALPLLVWGAVPRWTPRTPGSLATQLDDPLTVIRRKQIQRNTKNVRRLDLRGRRIGRLTVDERDMARGHRGGYWLCTCDCGTKNVSRSQDTLRKSTGADCGPRCPLRVKATLTQ